MARDRDDRDEEEEEEDRPRRRRPRDDDDDEYEDRRPPQTTNPGLVKTAAILWIVFGALAIASALLEGVVMAAGGGFTSGVIARLSVGAAFLITGIQTLGGSVSSILGAGIASVILASLGLLLGILIFVVGGLFLGGGPGVPAVGGLILVVGAIALIGPTMLMVAGILAIKGNNKYKLWLAYLQRQKSVSRGSGRGRVRDEYEEDDERPRRKRPRADDEE